MVLNEDSEIIQLLIYFSFDYITTETMKRKKNTKTPSMQDVKVEEHKKHFKSSCKSKTASFNQIAFYSLP